MSKLTKLVIAGICLVGVILIYKFWSGSPPPSMPAFVVEAETVKPGVISRHLELLTTVRPYHQAVFVAHQKGRMSRIHVSEGTHVKSGTVLAELENVELQRSTEHAQLKADLAKSHYDRILDIYKQGSQSKASEEKAHELWLQAEIEYETLKKQLNETKFIIPFDGTCGIFKVREGQSVSAGDTIVTCFDVSKFVLDIDVPETILSDVKSGQKITYKDLEGHIESVQNIIDPETRMGIARAIVPHNWPIAVGQLISVDVELTLKKNVIAIPKTAVFLKDGRSFVYLIQEDKAALTPVKLGVESQKHVEIVEGLKTGDKYVLRGQESLWPTRDVKIVAKTQEVEKKVE